VVEPHAVGIGKDEEHLRFRGFEFVGAEIVGPLQSLNEMVDERFELVRCQDQLRGAASKARAGLDSSRQWRGP
jgi:hypothetical protein